MLGRWRRRGGTKGVSPGQPMDFIGNQPVKITGREVHSGSSVDRRSDLALDQLPEFQKPTLTAPGKSSRSIRYALVSQFQVHLLESRFEDAKDAEFHPIGELSAAFDRVVPRSIEARNRR